MVCSQSPRYRDCTSTTALAALLLRCYQKGERKPRFAVFVIYHHGWWMNDMLILDGGAVRFSPIASRQIEPISLQLMCQGAVVARVLWAIRSLRSPRSSKRGAYDSYGFIVVANVLEERVFSRRGRN